MEIHVYNNQTVLPLSTESVQEIVRTFFKLVKKQYEEVSIHFVEEKEICRLHEEFFDDPTPTDCISFPMDLEEDVGHRILGEVFISPQAALDYVKSEGGDSYIETTLYIIHGLLHLLGYDDMTDEDEIKMRAQEKIHLDHLAQNHVYLKT